MGTLVGFLVGCKDDFDSEVLSNKELKNMSLLSYNSWLTYDGNTVGCNVGWEVGALG